MAITALNRKALALPKDAAPKRIELSRPFPTFWANDEPLDPVKDQGEFVMLLQPRPSEGTLQEQTTPVHPEFHIAPYSFGLIPEGHPALNLGMFSKRLLRLEGTEIKANAPLNQGLGRMALPLFSDVPSAHVFSFFDDWDTTPRSCQLNLMKPGLPTLLPERCL